MSLPFADEVAACRAAQAEWGRRSVRERLKPIRELRHLLVERADAICDVIGAEIGRPAAEVVGTELLPAAAALKFLEKEAARVLKPRKVGSRPIRSRMRWYSSGLSPCSATSSGVMGGSFRITGVM